MLRKKKIIQLWESKVVGGERKQNQLQDLKNSRLEEKIPEPTNKKSKLDEIRKRMAEQQKQEQE